MIRARIPRRAATAALLAVVPLGAAAQTPRDTVRLAPIIVTATRVPVERDAVANAVTVLHGEDLARRGIVSVADALRLVPGVSVVESGPHGSVTSLFLRGGESDYVRVLVDGVPVNQPGGSINLADLTLDNVDRIEIVRGPASAVYGSDAVSGVIQVFTRQGGTATATALATDRGSLLQGAVAGRARGVAMTFGASRLETPGVYRLNHGYRGWTASALVRGAPRAGADAQLALRHQDGVFRYPTDFTGTPNDSNQYTTGRLTAVSLDAAHALSASVELRALAGFTAGTDRAVDEPDNPGDMNAYSARTTYGRRSADVRVNVRTAGRGIVTAGAMVERQAFRGSSDTIDLTRGTRAVYGQIVGAVGSSRVMVTMGARLEDNERFGRAATWRGGVTMPVGPSTTLRMSAGTAFKEPTFYENYGGGFSAGNHDLSPERSVSGDIGVDQRLGHGALLSVTAFAQRFDSLIQYTYFIPTPGGSNYSNITGAVARGVEVEFTAPAWRGGRLAASWTWLHTTAIDSGTDGTTFVADRPLIRRPAHSGSISAAHSATAVSAGATVRYVGRREDVDFGAFPGVRVTLRPYLRLDLDAAIAVARGTRAIVRVENATGADYQEAFGFPARGTTAWVGVRLGQ